MNGIKIFSQNWLDQYATITASSGDAVKAYLYDQNQDSKWSSEGSSDATEESLEIIFNNWQGSELDRDFNRIILLNHNIKSCGFDYWDGAAWVEIAAAAFAAEDSAYTYIELAAPVSAGRVRVRPGTTQVANQDKEIGELKFCLAVLDGTQQWLSAFNRADQQSSGAYRTGEGRLVAWREWVRFAASGTLSDVSLADYQLLQPYMKTSALITVVFHEDLDPSECFECAVVTPPRTTLDRKTERYKVTLELQEK